MRCEMYKAYYIRYRWKIRLGWFWLCLVDIVKSSASSRVGSFFVNFLVRQNQLLGALRSLRFFFYFPAQTIGKASTVATFADRKVLQSLISTLQAPTLKDTALKIQITRRVPRSARCTTLRSFPPSLDSFRSAASFAWKDREKVYA